MIEYLEKFHIDPSNQNALIEIAKFGTLQGPSLVLENLEKFHIHPTDEDVLIEIAKFFAQKNCYDEAVRDIENFHINPSHQDALVEIAKICAQKHPSTVVENLEKFHIDASNQNAFIEIAKICAQKSLSAVLNNLEKFHIDASNQNALVEIAKICAKEDPSSLIENLEKFHIDASNQNALIEIAKICSEENSSGVVRNLEKFHIDASNQNALIEIAKICAKENPSTFVENLEKFHIDPSNQNALIEIAKICSKENSSGVVRNLEKFHIDSRNQNALTEIAKICAKENPSTLIENLEKFHIDVSNQNALIEIAKICALIYPPPLVENLEKFHIDARNQDTSIEIAKICAQKNPSTVVKHLEKFHIDSHYRDALIEIAKFCTLQGPSVVLKNLEKFHIHPTDENALIEIAKFCAQESYQGLGRDIEDFHINPSHQDALIEIAKISAKKIPLEVATNIEKFHIDSHHSDALIEVAKICAEKAPSAVVRNFEKFHIDSRNQNALIEIAKICAQQKASSLADHIQKFGIRDQTALYEIAKICVRQNAQDTAKMIDHFGVIDPRMILDICYDCILQDEESLYDILGYTQAINPLLNPILHESSIPQEQATRFHPWFMLFQRLMSAQPPDKQLPPAQLEQFIEQTLAHRNPKQRLQLVKAWYQINKNKDSVATYKALLTRESPKSYKVLPAVYLTLLKSKGVENTDEFFEVLPNRLHDQAKSLPIVLDTLNLLCQEVNLNRADIAHLLHILKNGLEDSTKTKKEKEQTLCTSCLNIKTLIENGLTSHLTITEMGIHTLEETFNATLRNLFKGIPAEDFGEKYHETFGTFRQPTALFIYRGGLQQLPASDKQHCTEALNRYVYSVLNKTFQAKRYDRSKSVHLQTVLRDPLLAVAWKEGKTTPLEILLRTDPALSSEESSFVFSHFLREKIQENHIGPIQELTTLQQYLENRISPTEALERLSKEKPPLLELQSACIRLCTDVLPYIERIKLLQDMLPLANGLEFQNDIRHAIEMYKSTTSKLPTRIRNWTVVDSDDPCDLLLAGTEVTGSCQRISGDPFFNKCLLGYILNGENRILAVKNSSGQIVARRIFRLLWDETAHSPVLFMEKTYTAGSVSRNILEALDTFATERAKELNLPLLLTDDNPGEVYPNTIQSLEGSAPFVYSDAGHGICPRGVFSITRAKKIT